MEKNISEEYQKFLEVSGDVLTKLRIVGYPVRSSKAIEINNLEDFKKVTSEIESYKSEDLKGAIKRIYGRTISKTDLESFLQMGNEGLSRQELEDSLIIVPMQSDKTVCVDDLVDYLNG